METEHQKWVNISYLAVAGLLGYLVFAGAGKIVGAYDLEAQVKNIDLMLRGVSILSGAALFLALYRSEQANQFMNEVVVELTRVTWPAPKDTRSATWIVIVMVLISGVILGFLDYLWVQLLKGIL
jgi:preprotein translocase subunit SecE